MAVALDHLAGEHGPDGPVGAAHPRPDGDGFAALQGWTGLRDELAVEHLGDGVNLTLLVPDRHVRPTSGLWKSFVKSRPFAFQWSMAAFLSSRSDWPISSSTVRKPISAISSRTSSATKKK